MCTKGTDIPIAAFELTQRVYKPAGRLRSAHRGCSARMSRRRQGRLTWPSVPLLMMRRVDVELVGTA